MGMIYALTIRAGRSDEAEWERQRKAAHAEASLRTMLQFEEARLLEKGNYADATSYPMGVSIQDPGANTHMNKERAKRVAPDMQRMLELLFDEVENGSIAKLGVDTTMDWYTRSVALLKEHTEFELREAIDKTVKSRGVMMAESSDPADLAEKDEWVSFHCYVAQQRALRPQWFCARVKTVGCL